LLRSFLKLRKKRNLRLRELYSYLIGVISQVSQEAKAEAKWIIEEVFENKFDFLILENPEVIKELSRIQNIVERRVKYRIPLHYIFKKAFFFGFEIYVDERVLIPRYDTEVVVEYVLNTFNGKVVRWLDLGTGSGAIALVLGKHLNGFGVASDLSMDALRVARRNLTKYGVKVPLLRADVLSAFKESCFDLIVTNPPYISYKERSNLSPEVLSEPPSALFGGEFGHELSERILSESLRVLVPGGSIIIETSPMCFEALQRSEKWNFFILTKEIYDLSGELRGIHLVRKS